VNDEAAIAYDEDDASVYVQGYMTDVTERRATEEKLNEAREHFRSLAEQLPLVSYIDDPSPDGRSMYVSPQIEGLVGITAEDWVADKGTFARVLHPDDRDEVLARTSRCRREGLPFECEYRMVTRTGEVVWVHDAAVPIGDPAAPRYWQGYVVDITERKEADAQGERMLEVERAQNEQLRELDVMKDEFVALVSYELRTPLTAIQGYTELVLDGTAGALNDEQRAMLAAVDRNSTRLFRLINDLLVRRPGQRWEAERCDRGRRPSSRRGRGGQRRAPACSCCGGRARVRVRPDPDGQGRPRAAWPGLRQPDLERDQVHSRRRTGRANGLHGR